MSNLAAKFFHKCLRAWQRPCVLCAAGNAHSPFCDGCRTDLPWLPAERCRVCALPVGGSRICGECLRKPPAFDRTVAVFSYAFPMDALIQAVKYERRLDIASALGKELASSATDAALPDVVIPVPLSSQRLLDRGFNQAHEIAKAAKLRPRIDACMRVKETPPQALLPWKERVKNVRGAFACQLDVKLQHVAIVDDVMTTGATLNELAKVVKKAGARVVSCWVVARTLKQD